MFYLLYDNTIVDSKNLPKNVKIEKIEKDDKDNAFLIQIQYLDFLKTRKIGYIKKQSENVYDLIEVGDLVRYEDDFLGTTLLAEVYMNYGKLSLFDETDIKNLDILAIYKPNEKGDYIKVWEKKDD